jgi:hypothetical integral membrane protein (TIGR02206 family)
MGPYFARDYSGPPFEWFGPEHVIALTIITLAGLCLPLLRAWNERQRRIFRYTLAIFLIIDELAWHAWAAYWDIWTIQFMLPLHMCSLMVWLSAWMLFTKNRDIYVLTYFIGIGGALQALLTPDITGYSFPHFRAFQTFIAHGLLVLIPIYMTLVEGFRPTLRSVGRVFIWTNLYMIPVFFLNLWLGSNYLFIAYKPEFPTLLDLLAPWPWYVLELEIVGLVIAFLLYLPFLAIDRRARQAAVA